MDFVIYPTEFEGKTTHIYNRNEEISPLYASFLLTLSMMGNFVYIEDKTIYDSLLPFSGVIEQIGFKLEKKVSGLITQGNLSDEIYIELKEDQVDLLPMLCILCLKSNNVACIAFTENSARSREILKLTSNMCVALGLDALALNDRILVNPLLNTLQAKTIDTQNDHRIALALLMTSNLISQKMIISNLEFIVDVYPSIFAKLTRIGLNIKILKQR